LQRDRRPAVIVTGKGSLDLQRLDLQRLDVAGSTSAITCLESCSIMGPGQVSAANGIVGYHAACADVVSGRKPRLRHSTCDTSWNSRSTDGADWAVCVDD
jgi:hypothetical protein